jgi:hypothetical protein
MLEDVPLSEDPWRIKASTLRLYVCCHSTLYGPPGVEVISISAAAMLHSDSSCHASALTARCVARFLAC